MENEKISKFKELLSEIFELDKCDLDFGVYRLLSIRRAEITQFINSELPKQISDIINDEVKQTSEVKISVTESKFVGLNYGMTKDEMESRNILFINEDGLNCIDKMINRIIN